MCGTSGPLTIRRMGLSIHIARFTIAFSSHLLVFFCFLFFFLFSWPASRLQTRTYPLDFSEIFCQKDKKRCPWTRCINQKGWEMYFSTLSLSLKHTHTRSFSLSRSRCTFWQLGKWCPNIFNCIISDVFVVHRLDPSRFFSISFFLNTRWAISMCTVGVGYLPVSVCQRRKQGVKKVLFEQLNKCPFIRSFCSVCPCLAMFVQLAHLSEQKKKDGSSRSDIHLDGLTSWLRARPDRQTTRVATGICQDRERCQQNKKWKNAKGKEEQRPRATGSDLIKYCPNLFFLGSYSSVWADIRNTNGWMDGRIAA